MTRHPGHGNRGQGRKGGGRESGSGDEVAPVATESGYAPAHTAANPVALACGCPHHAPDPECGTRLFRGGPMLVCCPACPVRGSLREAKAK